MTAIPAGTAGLPGKSYEAYPARADRKYIPALDGMRAFSIALVVTSHFWVGGPVPGGFGVTVFFFISGFLITRLLLAEMAETGTVNIASFYVRRFLRLYPALAVLVVVLSALYLALGRGLNPMEVVAALFYFINYYIIVHPPLDLPIRMLWSLAIEEHYYIFFPIFFLLFARSLPRLIGILALAAVAVLVWRLVLVYAIKIDLRPPGPALPYTYYATECRLDGILYGAILAALSQTKAGLAFVRRLLNWPVFCVATLVLLVSMLPRDMAFQESWRYAIQSAMLFPMLACCIFSEQFRILRQILEQPFLVWIGKLSYSIYLWHFGIARVLHKELADLPILAQVAIGLVPILVAASLSYYLIERPVLSLRAKWRS
jgi:peptidoglycan/LPS O-acetylase OafA/YrhL